MPNNIPINKIIYFDKESIKNILQENNKGSKFTQTDISSTTEASAEILLELASMVKMDVPFLARLSFLFSGKMAMSYALKRDRTTTITSTEISDFEKIKESFQKFDVKQVFDIENSSSFFRVAGGYLKMLSGGINGVDVKEFKAVMDSYEGYDTYKLDDKTYVRFNNTAFVSNYKRNDLLSTKMTMYCVFVGNFGKEQFNFVKQIEKMQTLITATNTPKTLSDLYPPQKFLQRMILLFTLEILLVNCQKVTK